MRFLFWEDEAVNTNFNAEKLALLSIDRKKGRKKNKFPISWIFVFILALLFFQQAGYLQLNYPGGFGLGKTKVEVASVVRYQQNATENGGSEVLTASGYVVAQKALAINSEFTSKLMKVFVTQGQYVKEGEVLGELEVEGLTFDMSRKEQEIAQSEATEKRLEAVALQTRAELKKAEETVKQFEQEMEEAKQNVELQQNSIIEAEASLREREATHQQILQDLERLRKLYQDRIVSLEDFEKKQNQVLSSKASIDGAQSRIQQAKNNYSSSQTRVKQVQTRLDLAQADIAIQEARLLAAEAEHQATQRYSELLRVELKHLEYNRERLQLKAPWDGVIFSTVQPPGTVLTPIGGSSGALSGNNFLCEMLDPSSLMAEADIAESYIHKIALNQKVSIQLDALPNEKIEGTVASITPVANKQKATIQVKVRFESLDARVLHQMSVRLIFLREEQSQNTRLNTPLEQKAMILIPAQALLVDGNSVWIYREGTVRKKTVQTGQTVGNKIEILSGLEEGEQVVIRSESPLKENQSVLIQSIP